MGSNPRGLSAHCAGFVARPCILAILDSKGVDLPSVVIEMVTRLGSWSAVSGHNSGMSVYAGKVIDNYMDPYPLSLGHCLSDAEWAHKHQQYRGDVMKPMVPFEDVGRNLLPVQLRLIAWRSSLWSVFMGALDACGTVTIKAAYADEHIPPVNRYGQARRAFVVLKWHKQSVVAIRSMEMHSKRGKVWKGCVARVISNQSFSCHIR